MIGPNGFQTFRSLSALLAIVCCSIGFDDPPADEQPQPAPALIHDEAAWEKHLAEIQAGIKPNPPFEIPDNPPPHEGAMIDYPMVIEPPDLIQVEVLESLPGRPISGERLVRPDGTISLDFCGSVNVRGLTLEQAKEKIVLHLRKYLNDQALLLMEVDEITTIDVEMPREGDPKPPPVEAPEDEAGKPEPKDDDQPKVPPRRPSKPTSGHQARVQRIAARQDEPDAEPANDVPDEAAASTTQYRVVRIEPKDSTAVFVDFTAYNSKVYFVEGDVASTGRLPFTGNETVHDAIDHAGGLAPTADTANIKLIRPGAGEKPAKTFPIDWKAIVEKGDKKSNLQLFPGDRIFVGRKEVEKAAAVEDRPVPDAVADRPPLKINSATKTTMDANSATFLFQQAVENSKLDVKERKDVVSAWADVLWEFLSPGDAGMLSQDAFREALVKSTEQWIDRFAEVVK